MKHIWMKAAFGLAAATMTVAAHAAAKVGKPAPPFSLTTFGGQKVALEDLRGRVVLINHWATWCGPCRAELPAMDAFFRKYRARGLEMFAITTESSLPPRKLAPLSAAMAIPLSNRFRGSGYGPIRGAVPTSYVIDRAGIVRYAKSGAFDAESLAATLAPLIAEAEPAPVSQDQAAP